MGYDIARGVWPYYSSWVWGSAMGYQNEKLVALNLGGSSLAKSESSDDVLFYDGLFIKLNTIETLSGY